MTKLRKWQEECVEHAYNHYKENTDFFCLAAPGAGKSIMSAKLARKLIESQKVDLVICLAPSKVIVDSMKRCFEATLDQPMDGILGSKGAVFTYQALSGLERYLWSIFEKYRVLVVFDEIHHCAGNRRIGLNSWGEQIVSNIQGKATYTLALSGTPWRSDTKPLSLARYVNNNGHIQYDYAYGLSDAVKDGVCRTPKMVVVEAENITVENQEFSSCHSNLEDLFSNSCVRFGQFLQNTDALKFLIQSADFKLKQLRSKFHRAGGLVVASNIEHANLIQATLYVQTGYRAEIISYQTPKADLRIKAFRQSCEPWVISIGMISEGTDIPRLQVCCYLSRITTELYFRQVLGRVLRVTKNTTNEGWLYTFAEPNLKRFASQLSIEVPNTATLVHSIGTLSEDSLKPITRRPHLPLVSDNEAERSKDIIMDFDSELMPPMDSESSRNSCWIETFRERIVEFF